MTIDFDPQIPRPNIASMKLKAEGTELRVAVVLTRADGSTFEDVVDVKPSDLPVAAHDWFEDFCAAVIKERYE